jgi:hypothetical protein
MDKCKAYKSKTTKIQCSAKIKTGFFCGRHQTNKTPIFDDNGDVQIGSSKVSITSEQATCDNKSNAHDKLNTYKKIASSDAYSQYLDSRKLYMKDTSSTSNKLIELVEYLENSKMDFYPYFRILATLEHYKLLNVNEIGKSSSKFLLVRDNIAKLESFFMILLKANTHLDKLVKLQRWIRKSMFAFNKKLHGSDRSTAVNDSDFVSLDDIKDGAYIPLNFESANTPPNVLKGDNRVVQFNLFSGLLSQTKYLPLHY